MKLIPSPNIYKNDQCLQYSEQELLPGFTQQEYAMKWIALQLALLSYMAAVGYLYKNHKTSITATCLLLFGANFCVTKANLEAKALDVLFDSVVSFSKLLVGGVMLILFGTELPEPPPGETLESCRVFAERHLYDSFYAPPFVVTASVAAITTGVSIYYCTSNFFTKKLELKGKQELRQTQLEEFGFKSKTTEGNFQFK